MTQKLYVILGDVISSRKIDDRDGFRKNIERACQAVTSRYSEDIYTDFKILKGIDEFGGVLYSITNVYNIISTILNLLYPESVRFVLVLDYIDTGLETGDVARMDGPAFHRAADMINNLKKLNLKFHMSVGDEVVDSAISGEINLILIIKSNWSATQFRAVQEYEKDKSQSEVAEILGVTQQAVSKALTRSMWKDIRHIEGNLNYILNSYQKRLNQRDQTYDRRFDCD